MSALTIVRKVKLTERHLSPGRTKPTLSDAKGLRDFPLFTSLAIARVPESSHCYLFYFPDQGIGADTIHLSFDDAIAQAEWEFGVLPTEWEVVDEPF